MRLYLDASAIIYSIEGLPPFRDAALRWIQDARRDPDSVILTSRLSMLECRAKPLRDGAESLLAEYEGFFRRARVIEISAAVVDGATRLRVQLGFKVPDAIHLASATVEKAHIFLTGDTALARCPGLDVRLLTGAG